MCTMFCNCNSLLSLPDISKLDTFKVISMRFMFNGCISLYSLPDISKWKLSDIKFMGGMFSGCYSLTSLPDISKWNIQHMGFLFEGCKYTFNHLLLLSDSFESKSKITV